MGDAANPLGGGAGGRAAPAALPDLGFPTHFGFVVADLDAALVRFGALFGIAEWDAAEVTYPARYRGRAVEVTNRLAFGAPGGGKPYLELSQPGPSPSPARDHLDRRGEGLYHVGYRVPGPLRVPPGLVPVLELAEEGGSPVVYLEPEPPMGFLLELAEARPTAEGAPPWD